MNNDCDYLNILTKQEIISFLKSELWCKAPEKYRVVFFKWKITADKLQKEMREHLNDGISAKLAKEHDELVDQLNQEKESSKKSKILEKIRKIDLQYLEHEKKWKLIDKKQELNDKFLEKIKQSKEEI